MENYEIGEVKEVEEPGVFSLGKNDVTMRVSPGTKIRNVMGFAMKKIKEPDVKQLCWAGSGKAITKTVSCAEIMKRKVKGLHQITRIRYRRIEEYWEPKVEGLDRLKVNRDVPAISILLSKEPLNTNELGYQAPGSFDEFWKDVVTKDRLQADRKRKGSRPEVDTKVSQGQGQNNRNKGQQKKQNVGKAVSEKKTEKGKKEQMELRT